MISLQKAVDHCQVFNTIFCTSRTRMSFVVLLWANWFIKVLILYGNFRLWFRELFFYFSRSVWCIRFAHFHRFHLQMTFVVGHVARCRNVLVSDFEGFLPSSEPHYMGLECHLRRLVFFRISLFKTDSLLAYEKCCFLCNFFKTEKTSLEREGGKRTLPPPSWIFLSEF